MKLNWKPKDWIVKMMTVIIMLNVILSIFQGNIWYAFKTYMIITMTVYAGNWLLYKSKRIESVITPWKALAWCVAVFRDKTRRWMFR